MNLLILKWKQMYRIIKMIPFIYYAPVLILLVWLVYIVLDQLAKYPNNIFVIIIYAVILFICHRRRKDKEFLKTLYQNFRLLCFIEYSVLSIPLFILTAIAGNVIFIPVIIVSIIAVVLSPQIPPVSIANIRYDILFGNSYEWISGCRRSTLYLLFFYCLYAAILFVSHWAILAYLLVLFLCTDFYREGEPVTFLLLPGKTAASYIKWKIKAAILNFHILSLPFYLLAILLHPDVWWLLVLLSVCAATCLVFCISVKYAYYIPNEKHIGNDVILGIGILGSVIPVVYPLTILLIIRYLLPAKNNLKLYLND